MMRIGAQLWTYDMMQFRSSCCIRFPEMEVAPLSADFMSIMGARKGCHLSPNGDIGPQ